jgi:hypothetical protein
MGMSTHVIAFKPPDEKWQKMKRVYDTCTEAGVGVPDEVDKFFNYDRPDTKGVEISEGVLTDCGALKEWDENSRSGFEVDVTKLPKDVTIIRFYNSW